jgi:ATP-dependent DNA ligase
MLARSGHAPENDYAFEVKWDGFCALVSSSGEFRLLSKRGWDMTSLVPELADLPLSGLFDGELVAFADGRRGRAVRAVPSTQTRQPLSAGTT